MALTSLARGKDFDIGTSGQQSAEVSGDINVTCTQCYIKGEVIAQLSAGHLNVSRIVDQTVDQVEGNVNNLTSEIVDYVGDWVKNVTGDSAELFTDFFEGEWDDLERDWNDLENVFDAKELPTFDYDFDMHIPALPEVSLSFGFDSFELFMMLETALSLDSTYTYNLYHSNSPIGISVTDDLWFGVIFSVDLILAATGEIDISSGFHIKLDDGLKIDIALFGDEASGIAL